MGRKVYFISGLPRAGSTVLSAILKQNPKFTAGMTSPVASLIMALQREMSGGSDFSVFFDDQRRSAVLKSVFESYYAGTQGSDAVFDTNRTWTARASLLGWLYPDCRIICCVREVSAIVDSFERMLRKNPLQLPRIFNAKTGSTIYSRAEALMSWENGLIGLAWSGFREAWFSEEARRLIVIDYERLASQPQAVMRQLYRELGEEWFPHDFDHVEYDEPDYDAHIGMPGLHRVRRRVCFEKRESTIPPDLLNKYAGLNFWTKPEMNPKNVIIL
jgi:sulfotransferase